MADPSQAAASASTPRTQPGILRSKSSSDMSTISTSSESKASTITFAPLPCIDARKRRNSQTPIGIAGRAEMLRRNQRQFGRSCAEGQQSSPEDDDIPLPDIGKLMKGLWKAVSRGQKSKNGREVSRPPNTATVVEGETEEDGEGSVWVEEVTWTPSSVDTSSSTNFPRKDHPQ